ncbi:hypothetical protein [Serratia symbiotica]|uniref:hypothetical protein n=1 Tax=Serratia symbiotica TaxID=138074 RepID=UPI003EB84290
MNGVGRAMMCNDQGKPQPLLILGMGKLGGGELNFSSDIDLIFAYPENGHTRGGRRERDNAQFFTRFGQRLIKALDQQTMIATARNCAKLCGHLCSAAILISA